MRHCRYRHRPGSGSIWRHLASRRHQVIVIPGTSTSRTVSADVSSVFPGLSGVSSTSRKRIRTRRNRHRALWKGNGSDPAGGRFHRSAHATKQLHQVNSWTAQRPRSAGGATHQVRKMNPWPWHRHRHRASGSGTGLRRRGGHHPSSLPSIGKAIGRSIQEGSCASHPNRAWLMTCDERSEERGIEHGRSLATTGRWPGEVEGERLGSKGLFSFWSCRAFRGLRPDRARPGEQGRSRIAVPAPVMTWPLHSGVAGQG